MFSSVRSVTDVSTATTTQVLDAQESQADWKLDRNKKVIHWPCNAIILSLIFSCNIFVLINVM